MDMTFSDMIDYTDIYVDDIVVYSESLEDLVTCAKLFSGYESTNFLLSSRNPP